MAEEYNGWTNRETWAANLWITNQEWTYNHARRIVTEYKQVDAEQLLTTWLDELLYDDDSPALSAHERNGWRKDVGSLWRINWREIVENLRDAE